MSDSNKVLKRGEEEGDGERKAMAGRNRGAVAEETLRSMILSDRSGDGVGSLHNLEVYSNVRSGNSNK
ncbi:hypothetical protein RRG08_013687 [Elysia crispata]|uniref:Uncharacterized protein n=1 Tax=Elysia crispata TaxID=231223 RepID=A0AAE1DIS6_9GAST|nr:hypothetical protein RRG08_013687 [Elysia crispata]